MVLFISAEILTSLWDVTLKGIVPKDEYILKDYTNKSVIQYMRW